MTKPTTARKRGRNPQRKRRKAATWEMDACSRIMRIIDAINACWALRNLRPVDALWRHIELLASCLGSKQRAARALAACAAAEHDFVVASFSKFESGMIIIDASADRENKLTLAELLPTVERAIHTGKEVLPRNSRWALIAPTWRHEIEVLGYEPPWSP